MSNSIAIYIDGHINVQQFVQQMIQEKFILPTSIDGIKDALVFANFTIDALIEAEWIHNISIVKGITNKQLQEYSSGEKKKLLLPLLLQKQPPVLIVCNFYDYLDGANKQNLEIIIQNTLCRIIQIVQKQNEILPFIKNKYFYTNNQFSNFNSTEFKYNNNRPIPLPLTPINTNANTLVEFKDVLVTYASTPILIDISFTINKGEFWQITGANGTGKSTILSMIIGDNVKAYNQQIKLFGQQKGTGESIWDIKQKVGYYAPSITARFDKMDTVQNMIIGGLQDSIGLYNIPTSAQIAKANEWLQYLQLEAFSEKPFKFLTVAQQRLVLIARAFIKHPPLLIIDEPTADISDAEAATIVHLINSIANSTTSAIMYVSHTNEKDLKPTHIYTLQKTEKGSIGELNQL